MRVLIIEDDPVMAKIIRMTLEAEGYSCDINDLGEDGLRTAKQAPYDIVLLDLMLPDIDGYEVLSRLRGAGVATPVLIVSSYGEAGNLATNKMTDATVGINDFLTKPFNRKTLVTRVGDMIDQAQNQITPAFAPETLAPTPVTQPLAPANGLHKVDVGGAQLMLTGDEHRLLRLLSLRQGKIIPRTNAIIHLYDTVDTPSDPTIVDTLAEGLQRKLSRAMGGHDLIDIVPDRGYLLRDTAPALA